MKKKGGLWEKIEKKGIRKRALGEERRLTGEEKSIANLVEKTMGKLRVKKRRGGSKIESGKVSLDSEFEQS